MSIRLTCGGSQVQVLYRPPKEEGTPFGVLSSFGEASGRADPKPSEAGLDREGGAAE